MYEKKEMKNNTGALFTDDKVSVVRKGKIKINDEIRYASIIKFEIPNQEPKYELSISVGLLHVNDAESKKNFKSPDISGTVTIDNQQFKFGGWSKQSDSGVKYTSVGMTDAVKKEESTSESYFPSDEVDDGVPFWMSKRIVDKNHLRYVSTLPCFVTKAGFMSCKGPIQVHHLLKPNDGYKGTSNRLGVKSNDSDVIPLCQFHHAQLHTKFGNEYNFLKHYGFKETAAQEYAKQLWDSGSDIYECDDELPF